jgi:hypothetical protein
VLIIGVGVVAVLTLLSAIASARPTEFLASSDWRRLGRQVPAKTAPSLQRISSIR